MPRGVYVRKNKKTEKEIKLSKRKAWNKFYQKNKKDFALKNKERRLNNKEYYIQYEKDRYAKNPEFYKQKWLKYCKENRQKINDKRKKRYDNDIDYKLRCILRSRFYLALRNKKHSNESHSDFYGCSLLYLKEHIESQFKDGMSWNNWSQKGWHIDHIIPLCKFDLNNEKELRKAFHYTNLQPLWAKENQSKNKSNHAEKGSAI